MEQNSIILVNKYSLSRLSTGFSVFSFFLMLKKVTSRETKFWLMYSIEYSTRNQQQNTEWWHIEWTSRVVNYNETIERERESSYNTIIFFFSLFIFNFFPFFCCCFFFVEFDRRAVVVDYLFFHPVSHRYIWTTLSWST